MGGDLFSITFSLSLSWRKPNMTTMVDWNSMLTSSSLCHELDGLQCVNVAFPGHTHILFYI